LACTYSEGGDKKRKAILHFINAIADDSKMEPLKGVPTHSGRGRGPLLIPILMLNQSLWMFWHSLRFFKKNIKTDGSIWKYSPKAPLKAENGFLHYYASL